MLLSNPNRQNSHPIALLSTVSPSQWPIGNVGRRILIGVRLQRSADVAATVTLVSPGSHSRRGAKYCWRAHDVFRCLDERNGYGRDALNASLRRYRLASTHLRNYRCNGAMGAPTAQCAGSRR